MTPAPKQRNTVLSQHFFPIPPIFACATRAAWLLAWFHVHVERAAFVPPFPARQLAPEPVTGDKKEKNTNTKTNPGAGVCPLARTAVRVRARPLPPLFFLGCVDPPHRPPQSLRGRASAKKKNQKIEGEGRGSSFSSPLSPHPPPFFFSSGSSFLIPPLPRPTPAPVVCVGDESHPSRARVCVAPVSIFHFFLRPPPLPPPPPLIPPSVLTEQKKINLFTHPHTHTLIKPAPCPPPPTAAGPAAAWQTSGTPAGAGRSSRPPSP